MEKIISLLRRKTRVATALAAGTLVFASCAQDGFDEDERFGSSVTNTAMTTPTADEITIQQNVDGTQTVISWPFVGGAGGYLCTVLDITDAENPVALNNIQDSVIDRCQLAVPREVEHNYTFSIRTLGRADLNNTDSETTTEVAFNSFTAALGTIPDSTDITEYITNNPMPEEAVETEMAYDLVPGGQYTMTGDVDFGNKLVQLRSTAADNPATVVLKGDASIMTSTGLSIKNVNFDCSKSKEAFIALSDEPDESIMGVLSGSQNYYDIQPPASLLLQNCHITGVNNYFIYDNNKKYCLGTAIIRDCVVQLTSTEKVSGVIRFQGGFINDLTIENSTFWGIDGADASYFVQYNNSGRCDRGGYTSNSITYKNCTFYNVANSGQWGNYNGFAGRNTSYWNMTNCIFVDCGNNQVPRRYLGGRQNCDNRNFLNNTYMYDGAFESTGGSVASYDDSASAIEMNPGFKDAANGDFTVSGSEQIARGTGDPRWLPANQ